MSTPVPQNNNQGGNIAPQQQMGQNNPIQNQNPGQPIPNSNYNPNAQPINNQNVQPNTQNPNTVIPGQGQVNPTQGIAPKGNRFVDLLSTDQLVAVSWVWKQPEKIDETKVKKGWDEATRFSENRLKVVEDLPTYPREVERDYILLEEEDLKTTIAKAEKITQLASLVNEANADSNKLVLERQNLQPKYQGVLDAFNKSNTTLTELLGRVEADRNESLTEISKFSVLALKVDTAELAKFNFKDNKKKSNLLFSWISTTILGKAKTAYDWESFKKENLTGDNARNFKLTLANYNLRFESISGLPETTTKALQAVYPSHDKLDINLTNEVLNERNNIIAESKVKNNESESVKALLEYVATVKRIVDKNKDMQSLNAQYNTLATDFRQKSIDLINIEKDVASLEKRIQILKEFVNAYFKELSIYDKIIKNAQNKSNLHTEYVQKLGGRESVVRSKSINVSPIEIRKSITDQPGGIQVEEIKMEGCANSNCSGCNIF